MFYKNTKNNAVMAKRKLEQFESDLLQSGLKRVYNKDPTAKKHSLDSDEEDNVEEDDGLEADDIEGVEDGVARQDDGIRMTAFNMQEEMEEGHFDKDGHFIWKNEKDVRDNWLDNIEWQQIKKDDSYKLDESQKGLADESDSEEETPSNFNEIETYKKIFAYMKPKETINKTIQRLGGNDHKLSSVERLKRKKAGTLNDNKDVTDITELANNILNELGNMDVYQETYEQINTKIENSSNKVEPELDMYSDDFDSKERQKITAGTSGLSSDKLEEDEELKWEFKWAKTNDKIEGPFTTKQMLKWTNEGYFKTGVWVRKCGECSAFYTSNRIDFELYI